MSEPDYTPSNSVHLPLQIEGFPSSFSVCLKQKGVHLSLELGSALTRICTIQNRPPFHPILPPSSSLPTRQQTP